MNLSFRKEIEEELYGNSNWCIDHCPCVHGRHDDHRLCRRQDQHQGQRRLSRCRPQNGPVHGRVLPVRQQHRRRLHHGPGPEGLRRVGHQRDLVRPGGVPGDDPPGLFCSQDPQDHGCHDPRGRWPPLRQALQQLHGGAQRSVAVLPDVFPDRRFRRGHQRSDPVDPPERLPAAGRLRHHLLYHLRRHDR